MSNHPSRAVQVMLIKSGTGYTDILFSIYSALFKRNYDRQYCHNMEKSEVCVLSCPSVEINVRRMLYVNAFTFMDFNVLVCVWTII